MTYYFDFPEAQVAHHASGMNNHEVVCTYTPWWYEDNEKEDESSGSPILWGVGGLLVGALLMAMVFLFLRKRTKLFKSAPEQEAPSRENLLRKRAQMSGTPTPRESESMNAGWAPSDNGLPASEEGHSVEVRQPDAIPGETMAELAARLQGCLGREGVRVPIKDVGKILGSYASVGSVRIAAAEETYPAMLIRASKVLSEFFCVSLPGSTEPAPDYCPADATVPQSYWTVVSMSRLDLADRVPFGGGMNREIFRGILREAEEEFFLPENVWTGVDVLLDRYTKDWVSPARHLMVRNMENISTCMLAVGADPEETLDYAMYKAIFLRLNRKHNRKNIIALGEAFEELFREQYLPLCRGFLADYMPTPAEPEPRVQNNQTIHGGEYESVQ